MKFPVVCLNHESGDLRQVGRPLRLIRCMIRGRKRNGPAQGGKISPGDGGNRQRRKVRRGQCRQSKPGKRTGIMRGGLPGRHVLGIRAIDKDGDQVAARTNFNRNPPRRRWHEPSRHHPLRGNSQQDHPSQEQSAKPRGHGTLLRPAAPWRNIFPAWNPARIYAMVSVKTQEK